MQTAAPHSTPPEPGLTTRGVISRVIDGDTVEVQVSRVIRVRLLDCWAPESRSRDPREMRLGLAAKRHLSELAEGRFCIVHIPADERGHIAEVFTFGRVLGRVWAAPGDFKPEELVDLAEAMVAAGLATKGRRSLARFRRSNVMPRAARRHKPRGMQRIDPVRRLYYSARWRKLRAEKLASTPNCEVEECDQPATDVDHRRPHRGDPRLFFAARNLQSLCHSHHSRKTATRDGGFGRGRIDADSV